MILLLIGSCIIGAATSPLIGLGVFIVGWGLMAAGDF